MAAPDYAEEIAQLEGALANGELEIRSADGSRTVFQSATDIRSRISYFKGLAAAASSSSGRTSRTTYASFGVD